MTTMTKNCPNCGAPIDIHRASCEYCGTPYERNKEELAIYYADNVPFYIYQEPLNIDPIEIQKRILEEQNRRLINQVESNTSSSCGVPDMWEEPVCPENSMLKDILLLISMCAPFIVFIFLKVFNII